MSKMPAASPMRMWSVFRPYPAIVPPLYRMWSVFRPYPAIVPPLYRMWSVFRPYPDIVPLLHRMWSVFRPHPAITPPLYRMWSVFRPYPPPAQRSTGSPLCSVNSEVIPEYSLLRMLQDTYPHCTEMIISQSMKKSPKAGGGACFWAWLGIRFVYFIHNPCCSCSACSLSHCLIPPLRNRPPF
ncbi:hypothetical protein J2Z70_003539 [Paenibacillus silagei]|uniref:Uncharacterized protein n=1 Tax=Paenibacillus silagei TaxID=1670801 RepID=A0ABS4NVC7_9BACL|nr:hypothetical protein [Paenibacillus silagei]